MARYRWLRPTWWAPPLRMHRRSLAEQHPVMLCLGILFGVAFVITCWPVFVAAGAAYVVFLTARAVVRRHRRRQRVHAATAARADFEHAALMGGDEWLGTFGRHQPAPWWRA
jgi:hypothetical protein